LGSLSSYYKSVFNQFGDDPERSMDGKGALLGDTPESGITREDHRAFRYSVEEHRAVCEGAQGGDYTAP
jgi:hypothetical protein